MCACAEGYFKALQNSPDVSEIASAWRVSGGAFFKVQFSNRVIWDISHAFSLKACNHICEMVIIVICFGSTVGVFAMLLRSKEFQKEREQTGERAWAMLEVLFGLSVLMGLVTVRTLWKRWRKVSTEVFTSEV